MEDPKNPPCKLYFAYGSNLSTTQMRERCPSSPPVGLAYLSGWYWIISGRGYANVVRREEPPCGTYGVLYRLTPADEATLDRHEGVPRAYQKVDLDVRVERSTSGGGGGGGLEQEGQTVPALVYVGHDELSVTPGPPRDEYVFRMNRAIDEAHREFGLPEEFIDSVMREFIPPTKQ